MTARCIDEPISWLRLERYHLGEVDGAERARIEAHLAACAACAACAASIEQDDAVALPPLPVARLDRARGAGRSRARLGAMVAGGLALAAAVALGVGNGWKGATVDGPSGGARVKGDAVSFSLVRDDDARIDGERGVYRDGDRFKAVVTCPPSMDATFDVVVYEADGGASFPLASSRLACGNGVPVPGAFRLTGSADETVCLVWGSDAEVERGTLVAAAPVERSLCKRLTSGAGAP